MKSLLISFLSTLLIWQVPNQCFSQQATGPTYLPSILMEGRFYLKIPALNGDTLLGLCDTGGGYTAIYPKTVGRLKMDSKIAHVTIKNETTDYILTQEIYDNPVIPKPKLNPYFRAYEQNSFFEVADQATSSSFTTYIPHDVFLGQFFFIGHAWIFDYQAGKIMINAPLGENSGDKNIQKLSFKREKSGNKQFAHPRMSLSVDGDKVDMLFDTGASFILSEAGKVGLGTSRSSVAGSFIAKSIFDTWRQRHPDWRVLEKGELTGSDLIEVPQVQIGTLVAGPVWFASRDDEVWRRMASSMDKPVKGAIGGSFLQYFKVQIDYNNDLIRFEK